MYVVKDSGVCLLVVCTLDSGQQQHPLCLVCSPASLCHRLRKRREVLDDCCGLLRSFFLFCCVSFTVALLCCGAVALLCLLHGCAGVRTSLDSVATSFEASCERLP